MTSRLHIHLTVLLLLLFSIALWAQPQEDAVPFENFSQSVESRLPQWGTPGAAVGVVKEGKVLYSRGFGYRDLEAKTPVTPQSLFCIASCTKSFTAFAAGLLVDDGKVDFDRPLITYLPDFKLSDAYATQHATLRDLLSHQTGLPGHNRLWKDTPLSGRQLYKRLRHLPFSHGFREKFQYNNLLYMIVGLLVEKVSGKTWKEFVKQRIFMPLGMGRSRFSFKRALESGDVALPYNVFSGKAVRVTPRSLQGPAPAAAIHASVEDMLRWVRMNLDSGMVNGKPLITKNTLAELHRPQAVIPDTLPFVNFPVSLYGMGWEITPYRDTYLVWHQGGTRGYQSVTLLVPGRNFGIVVLSNDSGVPLNMIIALDVLDRMLGVENPIDWNSRLLPMYQKKRSKPTEEKKETVAPPQALTSYTGAYSHDAYGTLTVTLQSNRLHISYYYKPADLEFVEKGTFKIKGGPLNGLRIRFAGKTIYAPMQKGCPEVEFKR
ncbi:MAG: serine hydrolase [bacterium]|nr:serine hydrolase [bacterium]